MRRVPVLTAVIAVLGALLVTVPVTPATAAPGVRWTQIASGFTKPTQVTAPQGVGNRLYVVEQTGIVRLIVNGQTQATPFLDIRSLVRTDGEAGLLSIAFNVGFATSPYVFAAYSSKGKYLTVVRYSLTSPTAPTVNYASRTTLIGIPHPTYTNHWGGQVVYSGYDGTLLISTGDGGGAGDPRNNAQNNTQLLGKVLRIDPWHRCSGKAYCIPANNPLVPSTSKARKEIWLTGLRNAWRMSMDAATRRIWVSDVGQDAREEVNAMTPWGYRNLGWSCREGTLVYNSSRCGSAALTAPTLTIAHPDAKSLIGGYVYRGSTYPQLAGHYIFGDFVTGRVWDYSGGTRKTQPQGIAQLTSIGEGPGRELYASAYDGRIYRMTYS